MALSASYRRLLYEIRGIFHHTIHTRHRTLVQLGQLRFTGVIVKCCESSMTISATFSSKHMRLKPIPRRLGHGNVIIALSFIQYTPSNNFSTCQSRHLASRLPGERPLLETNGDILWTQQRSSGVRSERRSRVINSPLPQTSPRIFITQTTLLPGKFCTH